MKIHLLNAESSAQASPSLVSWDPGAQAGVPDRREQSSSLESVAATRERTNTNDCRGRALNMTGPPSDHVSLWVTGGPLHQHACVYTHAHTCAHTRTHMCTYAQVCMYAHLHMCTHVHIYMRVCVHTLSCQSTFQCQTLESGLGHVTYVSPWDINKYETDRSLTACAMRPTLCLGCGWNLETTMRMSLS